MFASFNRFELQMTRAQAESASHPGPCDSDVEDLVRHPAIARQLRKIAPDAIAAELKEYGAWDAAELADHAANQRRIVWIAAGNISEKCVAALMARPDYQDAITGANPRATAQLIRGLKASQ